MNTPTDVPFVKIEQDRTDFETVKEIGSSSNREETGKQTTSTGQLPQSLLRLLKMRQKQNKTKIISTHLKEPLLAETNIEMPQMQQLVLPPPPPPQQQKQSNQSELDGEKVEENNEQKVTFGDVDVKETPMTLDVNTHEIEIIPSEEEETEEDSRLKDFSDSCKVCVPVILSMILLASVIVTAGGWIHGIVNVKRMEYLEEYLVSYFRETTPSLNTVIGSMLVNGLLVLSIGICLIFVRFCQTNQTIIIPVAFSFLSIISNITQVFGLVFTIVNYNYFNSTETLLMCNVIQGRYRNDSCDGVNTSFQVIIIGMIMTLLGGIIEYTFMLSVVARFYAAQDEQKLEEQTHQSTAISYTPNH